MKLIKRAFGEFIINFIRNDHKCKFFLLYDLLKWDLIDFKMNNISKRKRIVDTDVVNNIT